MYIFIQCSVPRNKNVRFSVGSFITLAFVTRRKMLAASRGISSLRTILLIFIFFIHRVLDKFIANKLLRANSDENKVQYNCLTHRKRVQWIETCYVHETLWNLIGAVTRHDRLDYIGKVWNESENIYYTSYKIFIGSIHLARSPNYFNGQLFIIYYHWLSIVRRHVSQTVRTCLSWKICRQRKTKSDSTLRGWKPNPALTDNCP